MLAGIAFLAAVDAAYNAYGATNSSPQTTELFARDREETLMKWVRLGGAQAFLLTGLATWLTRSLWPIIGGGLVVAIMHVSYRYAAACGKRTLGAPSAAAAVTPQTFDRRAAA